MEESDQSDYGEDMLQMVEDDDIKFLKDAIDKKSYSILKKVKHIEYNITCKYKILFIYKRHF